MNSFNTDDDFMEIINKYFSFNSSIRAFHQLLYSHLLEADVNLQHPRLRLMTQGSLIQNKGRLRRFQTFEEVGSVTNIVVSGSVKFRGRLQKMNCICELLFCCYKKCNFRMNVCMSWSKSVYHILILPLKLSICITLYIFVQCWKKNLDDKKFELCKITEEISRSKDKIRVDEMIRNLLRG